MATVVKLKPGEAWRNWALAVYLIICMFDFIGAPWYVETNNRRLDVPASVTQSLQFPLDSQSLVFITLQTKRVWEPLTLSGGGTFHLAFGAILGVTAWKRPEVVQKPDNEPESPKNDEEAKG